MRTPNLASRALLVVVSTLPALADERPNIVIVMADDMGYSDIGCYGGEIETPNLDRLAAGGLRFTQFYNTGRCCPTRASLLTGLYAHQAGIGHMTSESVRMSSDWGRPGYRGRLNRRCVTIAEVLKPAGYHTLMAGKWHVGTFEGMWPNDRGFDEFFGIVRGASNFFRPQPDKLLSRNRTPIEPPADFYTTDGFTDHAIELVREASKDDDRPFFLYLAYTSPHWPLHAWPEDIAKYRGKYMDGWDELRRRRLSRMVELGIIDRTWKLTDRDAPDWATLSEARRRELDWRMAIYAAMIDRMDQNIGRLVKTLEELGRLDNTLILFLADNGGCAEGGPFGGGPAKQLGTKEGYMLSYGRGWANASNTPFRRYKHWVHEGGVASPLIAHWPARIRDRGAFRKQPTHLIDLMATCVELAKTRYPKTYRGRAIVPLEGRSLVPALDDKPIEREAIYWEHEGNRAVRMDRWKLVAAHGDDWQLHDMHADRTETKDLSTQKPELRAQMIAMYDAWASRSDVLPWRPRRPADYEPPSLPYPPTWEQLRRGVDIGSRRELFVDRHLIERLDHVLLELEEPRDEGPVLKFDRPWEGLFCGYATIIRDGEKLRAYYRGLPVAGKDGSTSETTCCAESEDGIRWTKPELGLFEAGGSRRTNIVLANAAPYSHNFSPFLDRRPDVPADQRYKALGGTASSGLVAFVSADGLRWRKLRDQPVFRDSGWVFDSQNVSFWSEAEKSYVLYYRSAPDGIRAVARATSADFVHWSEPVQMRYSDTGGERPSQHLYTSQTHPYFRAPHIYVSTAARFMPGRKVLSDEEANAIGVHPSYFNDTSDCVLMTTRGGDLFDRTFLGALIRPGIGAANWVSRTGYPALNIVQTGPTEMSLYVNQSYGQPTSHLRRYSMRLDGMTAVRAPFEGGEMLTKRLRFAGKRLLLNFSTSAAGSIRVEIQDGTGQPIPGYTLADAAETIGNEIERAVRWKGGADVGSLAGRTVRLRFVMRDARLFAMRFAP